jgi:hypothetical protein
MRFRVLDLDNSVAVQPFLGGLVAAGEADYIDARDLAPKLRIVANRAALAELGRRMQVRPSTRRQGDADVVYYGSGDFHHLTYLFLQQLDEPVTVVHFDNHPDWVRFPYTVNCGSWVARAVECANVRKVITIGPCSDDLANPQLKGADLRAIRAGRLEMYAWQAAPTRVWGRPVRASGVETVGGALLWRNLGAEDWGGFVDELARSLPDTAVWITVDKDVFGPAEAVTNWDQGQMQVEDVITAIRAVAGHRRVIGADICGDYSTPKFKDAFRTVLSWMDHPSIINPCQSDLVINNKTNSRLAAVFTEALL